MKNYNHTAIINLKKEIKYFINRITGFIISKDFIKWQLTLDASRVCIIDGKSYNQTLFDDEFTPYISRQQELIQETLNGRTYPQDLWIHTTNGMQIKQTYNPETNVIGGNSAYLELISYIRGNIDKIPYTNMFAKTNCTSPR